jgi:hypothetical protein
MKKASFHWAFALSAEEVRLTKGTEDNEEEGGIGLAIISARISAFY